MVLKPNEVAPPSAQLFAEFVDEAGFPAGVFNMIYGTGAAIGDALTSHPQVDMVSFTGSTRAGNPDRQVGDRNGQARVAGAAEGDRQSDRGRPKSL